ncbi:MAG: hypothetical protein LBC35_00755 [Coriobacteriales bacterium]|jgi:hypothetical protein|nr:hypothetical protein [Coriobacteriales bacterium]
MKAYPNKQKYHQILKTMSPQDRLMKAFELSDLANAAFKVGLKDRYPHATDAELDRLYLEKRSKCHNRNY